MFLKVCGAGVGNRRGGPVGLRLLYFGKQCSETRDIPSTCCHHSTVEGPRNLRGPALKDCLCDDSMFT